MIKFVTVSGSSLAKVMINLETRLVWEANYDFWNIHPGSRNGKHYLCFCGLIDADVRHRDDIAGCVSDGEDGRWSWNFSKKIEWISSAPVKYEVPHCNFSVVACLSLSLSMVDWHLHAPPLWRRWKGGGWVSPQPWPLDFCHVNNAGVQPLGWRGFRLWKYLLPSLVDEAWSMCSATQAQLVSGEQAHGPPPSGA